VVCRTIKRDRTKKLVNCTQNFHILHSKFLSFFWTTTQNFHIPSFQVSQFLWTTPQPQSREWCHQTSPPSFLIHISLAPDQLLEKLSKIILCFAAIKMTLFLVTRGLFDRQKPQKISDLLFPSENCCVYCSGIIHYRTTSYYFLNGGIHLVSLYKLMHNLNAMDKLRFRMQQNRQ
jgi:hypothetical protein